MPLCGFNTMKLHGEGPPRADHDALTPDLGEMVERDRWIVPVVMYIWSNVGAWLVWGFVKGYTHAGGPVEVGSQEIGYCTLIVSLLYIASYLIQHIRRKRKEK